MNNHKKMIPIFILILIGVFSISCSDKPSPETIARAFIQAASEGNTATMLSLSVDKPTNTAESFHFFVTYFEGVPTSDLTFQYQGNMNYGSNFHRYFVYQGTKNIAVVDVVQIGEQYYIDNATTTLWIDQ